MTTEELRAEIAELIGIEPGELTDDATRSAIAKWDSVAALMIVSFLDDRIDGTIEPDELDALTSFGAISGFARARGILAE